MAEDLIFSQTSDRNILYPEVLTQVKALVEGEPDLIANLANIAAVLKEVFGFFWVGFYIEKQGELVLGPFQGPVACTRIGSDKGVCGHSFMTKQTVIVPDVDKFPGHIACSSASRSEIVVPIRLPDGTIYGVLDVDSTDLDDFSQIDADGLQKIVGIIEDLF